jgi:TPR repeat protein
LTGKRVIFENVKLRLEVSYMVNATGGFRFCMPWFSIFSRGHSMRTVYSALLSILLIGLVQMAYAQPATPPPPNDVQRPAGDGAMTELMRQAESNPRAAYDLGLRYYRGDGVEQNSYQAIVWMRKAAERGNLNAQKALGGFYLYGLEEMGSDPKEAERWLQLAASRGDAESAKLLKEARSGKEKDQRDFEKRRSAYGEYWMRSYPYSGRWRRGAWSW